MNALLPPAIPDRPSLAPGVCLRGALQGSGFEQPQWLVERDGRFVQLTERLYRVAEALDGHRDLADIAAHVTALTDRVLTADHVRHVLATRLAPLGLLALPADPATAATPSRAPSPLNLNLRVKTIGPRLVDRAAALLQPLYAPLVFSAALAAILAAHVWLYAVHGVDEALRGTLQQPGSVLKVLVLMLLAGAFHELGHAAALRYGGGRARSIGAGIYFIYPVFYTDTTDSYRLARWARVRTDLGGFYFHLIFALGLVAAYALTGQPFLLLVVSLIDLDIVVQLLPFMRFDGYWAFADLTGLPDPFSSVVPFIRGLVPGARGSGLPPLKRWVKAIFGAYVLLGMPLLLVFLALTLVRVPVLLEGSLDGLIQLWRALVDGLASRDGVSVAAAAIQAPLVALPVVGLAYLLTAQAWLGARTLWRWSGLALAQRVAACLAALAGLALLAWLWSPAAPYLLRIEPAGVERYAVADRAHVTGSVQYAQVPPVGGNHAPVWQNCGFYAGPIPDERGVHSLEHGAVWITYRPDAPTDQVAALRALADTHSYVLVSAYPDLPAPVVASAWGRQLSLDSADDARLAQFVGAFHLGGQAPEQGGPCTGGAGTPE